MKNRRPAFVETLMMYHYAKSLQILSNDEKEEAFLRTDTQADSKTENNRSPNRVEWLRNLSTALYCTEVKLYWCSGYRVSNATFNAIVMRYSDKNGHIKFNDFVAAYIKLKTLFGKSFLLFLYVLLLFKIFLFWKEKLFDPSRYSFTNRTRFWTFLFGVYLSF